MLGDDSAKAYSSRDIFFALSGLSPQRLTGAGLTCSVQEHKLSGKEHYCGGLQVWDLTQSSEALSQRAHHCCAGLTAAESDKGEGLCMLIAPGRRLSGQDSGRAGQLWHFTGALELLQN